MAITDISRRDWLAGQALVAIMAGRGPSDESDLDVVKAAVYIADLLIAQLDAPPDPTP